MEKEKKGRAIALLPIGVFLIIFLGAGIVFQDFYAMPAIVAFLIALFVAFLQNKELSFNKKIEVIAKGVGEENIITMSLIFLCAGGFSGAVTAAGGVGQYSQFRIVIDPGAFCSCRFVPDRMFHFGFYGNFHGNNRSTRTDRSRNQ